MWGKQGLYRDMLDLRHELLKGIVEAKFYAIREEPAMVIDQKQLSSMPKLADSSHQCMSIIEEESESSNEYEKEGRSGPTKIHVSAFSKNKIEGMFTKERQRLSGPRGMVNKLKVAAIIGTTRQS